MAAAAVPPVEPAASSEPPLGLAGLLQHGELRARILAPSTVGLRAAGRLCCVGRGWAAWVAAEAEHDHELQLQRSVVVPTSALPGWWRPNDGIAAFAAARAAGGGASWQPLRVDLLSRTVCQLVVLPSSQQPAAGCPAASGGEGGAPGTGAHPRAAAAAAVAAAVQPYRHECSVARLEGGRGAITGGYGPGSLMETTTTDGTNLMACTVLVDSSGDSRHSPRGYTDGGCSTVSIAAADIARVAAGGGDPAGRQRGWAATDAMGGHDGARTDHWMVLDHGSDGRLGELRADLGGLDISGGGGRRRQLERISEFMDSFHSQVGPGNQSFIGRSLPCQCLSTLVVHGADDRRPVGPRGVGRFGDFNRTGVGKVHVRAVHIGSTYLPCELPSGTIHICDKTRRSPAAARGARQRRRTTRCC